MSLFEIVSTCKGGGYMYAKTRPLHPKANSKGLYPLHRVLAENRLNRILKPGEQVHHIDEDRTNNSLENLEVINISDHARLHAKKVESVQVRCSECNEAFYLKPCVYRGRIKANLGKRCFCSKACQYESLRKKN